MKAIIITIALITASATAYADYHYASHDGSDEYPYTSWETGAHLIQDAIDATNPHDTLYIGAGEWFEAAAVEDHDSIAIIGMGIDSTFCYADSNPVLTIDYECSVEGIRFQSYSNWACLTGRYAAGISVKNCEFINSYSGISASGGYTEITNCFFDSCTNSLRILLFVDSILISDNIILNSSDFGILIQGTNHAVIQNNVIISLFSADGIVSCGPSIIENNIVNKGIRGISSDYLARNNVIKYMGFGIHSNDPISVINNSIVNSRVYAIANYEGDLTANYNNLWNNAGFCFIIPDDTIGNIFCDPMFISDDDFHLQAFSPLIDAGDPDILDIDGTHSDIGAYGGLLGESYQYLDTPPAEPTNISGWFYQDTIFINWNYNTEADFNNYFIYKDTVADFEPSVFNLIAEPDTSCYVDIDVDNEHNYYYRITSIDNQDNISDYSEELEIMTTGIWYNQGPVLPQITSIKTNYPNPFNSSTTVIYSVANLGPMPAEIKITIYDIRGRRIRTLVNERKEEGEHIIIWNGRNDNGANCSSGVYFARISQWGLDIAGKPRKLVLVK